MDPTLELLPILVGLAVLYGLAVPGALLAHRRRRRARATTPDQRVSVAWVEAMEDAALIGFHERSSDTFPERAERLGETLPSARAGARSLAQARERAEYSPDGAGPAEVALADQGAAAVASATRAVATRSSRLRHWLDPRPELRAWRRSRAVGRRTIATTTATGSEHEPERPLVDVE